MTGCQMFTITEEHLKLLRRAYVSWEDCEYGAPAIDCKRPYGNSSVEEDMAEILGVPLIDGEYLPDEDRARLRVRHLETQTALEIILRTGTFQTGTYRRSDGWSRDWELVPPTTRAN